MPVDRIDDLRRALSAASDAAKAPQMAAYLQHRFPFLGVSAPNRRVATKSFVAAGKDATSSEPLDAATACWAQPERACHDVGTDLLARWAAQVRKTHPDAVRDYVADRGERLSGLTRREALKDLAV